MNLRSTLALAARRLLQRPVRSLLLLQGTVWGVAVAIFPSAVVQGTREAALTEGARIGADRISLAADPTASTATPLSLDDVEAVRSALLSAGLPPVAVGGARAALLSSEDVGAALVAGTPQTPLSRGLELAAGRGLVTTDGPRDCVVEAGVAAWLGRGPISPGETLSLPGRGEFVVRGVLAARAPDVLRTNDMGFDVEHPTFRKVAERLLHALGVPLVMDAWKRSDRCVHVLAREGPLEWVFVRAAARDVSSASKVARRALTERGRATVTFYPVVFPVLLSGKVDRFQAVDAALFLSCLVMGAVVMANLGLLTVLRRAREIAIRRVEGATKRDVALHFLLEGVLLTLVGCALGLVLGMGLAALRTSLEPVTGFRWTFPWVQAAVAVGVALVVGLLASLLPALRAAGQDPVVGLVDE